MKFNFILIACISIFLLGGCAKGDLSETLGPEDNPKSDMCEPCPTALFVQNLPPGQMVYVYEIGGPLFFTFTTTDYTTLKTSTKYRFFIPGGATVHYCSCGENFGTLTIPSDNVLKTSGDPTMYSTCDF